MCGFECLPSFSTLCFFARQLSFTKSILNSFQGHLDFIADGQRALATGVEKLIARNNTLRFEARVNSDPLVINVDNDTRHNRAGLHVNGLETFFE